MNYNYKTDNPKFHEDVFNEVGNIVKECHDFLNDHEAEALEVIYAIGSIEEGWYSFKVFFQIHNELFRIGQIKDKDDYESQIGIQQSGTDFLLKLKTIFESYDQQIPTQIKIQFFAASEEVKYNFQYDLIWSNNTEDSYQSEDVYKEWFEEIKNDLSN
ncbi:hypothetical protein [Kordia sp.]|uniref:hypothetical protein n=1 Tax=Kordia sp. TaxID=1965332 RepID=UPI003B59788D